MGDKYPEKKQTMTSSEGIQQRGTDIRPLSENSSLFSQHNNFIRLIFKNMKPSLQHMKCAIGQGQVRLDSLAVCSAAWLIYVATGLLYRGILLTTPVEPVSTCSDAHLNTSENPEPFQILSWGCLQHCIPVDTSSLLPKEAEIQRKDQTNEGINLIIYLF